MCWSPKFSQALFLKIIRSYTLIIYEMIRYYDQVPGDYSGQDGQVLGDVVGTQKGSLLPDWTTDVTVAPRTRNKQVKLISSLSQLHGFAVPPLCT